MKEFALVSEEKETKIAGSLLDLIGKTPLVRLDRYNESGFAEIVCKLESFNPGSSVKDRIGYSMVLEAERTGQLRPGATIVEPTSGNTGIGLALVAAIKGYKLILTMPSSMSVERRKLLIAMGAEIVLTDAQEGMPGAVKQALLLCEHIPNTYMPQQFNNPANPDIHYRTTGPEIWDDCEGRVDILISAVGTGGTISGTGKYLREKKPEVEIIAVEPAESAVMSGEKMGPHMIQGIGAGFIPEIMDMDLVDEIMRIDSQTAINTAKELALKEGLICGISAGANVAAAKIVAGRKENTGKRIVTIICDTGERYLSTLLFYQE
jgi:cysteine synthase A